MGPPVTTTARTDCNTHPVRDRIYSWIGGTALIAGTALVPSAIIHLIPGI